LTTHSQARDQKQAGYDRQKDLFFSNQLIHLALHKKFHSSQVRLDHLSSVAVNLLGYGFQP